MTANYYVILGIPEEATQDEIKHAYRVKALALHPDRYGPDERPFREVQEAYETLGNPARRHRYDHEYRPGPAVRLDSHPRGDVVDMGSPGISVARSFQTFTPSFEEIFDRFIGNFNGLPRPKAEGMEGLTLDVPIRYEDALDGGQIRILVPVLAACSNCRGRGGMGPFDCPRCRGAGRVSGDWPVLVPFPPGTTDGYTVGVALDSLGIRNLYLMVRLRVV